MQNKKMIFATPSAILLVIGVHQQISIVFASEQCCKAKGNDTSPSLPPPPCPEANWEAGQFYDRKCALSLSAQAMETALWHYRRVIDNKRTNKHLLSGKRFRKAADRFIQLARAYSLAGGPSTYMGHVIEVHKLLMNKWPEDISLRHQYATTLIVIGETFGEQVERMLKRLLNKEPSDAVAQALYGYVRTKCYVNLANGIDALKEEKKDRKTSNHSRTPDGHAYHIGHGLIELNRAHEMLQADPSCDLYSALLMKCRRHFEEGVEYMLSGLENITDGRLHYYLGYSLLQLERGKEAIAAHKRAANLGVFPTYQQRSYYNVPGLAARAWWTVQQTPFEPYLRALEDNWRVILEEGVLLMNRAKADRTQYPAEGRWNIISLYEAGKLNAENCRIAPVSCQIAASTNSTSDKKYIQRVNYSVIGAGARIHEHCAKFNYRLRAHLGLIIPNGAQMRIGNETRKWQQGKVIVFDDSFEHEVWNDGDSDRLVLMVDLWHPDLTEEQRNLIQSPLGSLLAVFSNPTVPMTRPLYPLTHFRAF